MFPSLALGREFRAGNWTPERSQIGSEANANSLRLQLVGTGVALRRPTGQHARHCGLQRPPEFGFPDSRPSRPQLKAVWKTRLLAL